MDSSFFRSGLTKPFAQNAEDITSIPDQKPSFGRASFSSGFPHETSVSIANGGIPPFLPDMNGALRDISNPIFLMGCGMPVIFNTDFATAIGGYPKGAVVWRDGRAYVSNIENNLLDTSNTNAWALRTPPAAATIDQNNSVDYLTGALLAPEISDILSKISSITIPQAASQDEVNAGQNGDKFVTPLTLASRLSKFVSGGQSGETGWRYELDGTITQWTVSDWLSIGEGSISITYPKPMSLVNYPSISMELEKSSARADVWYQLFNITGTNIGVYAQSNSNYYLNVRHRVRLAINGVPA